MAEGDGIIYNNAKEQLLLGNIDFVDNTLKLILVHNHIVDIDGDATYADVSADETAGAGYSAGGETLTGKAVTQDNTNNRGKFDADNVVWTGLNVSVHGDPNYAILYVDGASAGADYLVAAWELDTPTNGGDYTVQWHADGILLLT
jgi:hypothetical protein